MELPEDMLHNRLQSEEEIEEKKIVDTKQKNNKRNAQYKSKKR